MRMYCMPKKFPQELEWDVANVAPWGDLSIAEVAVDLDVSPEPAGRWRRQTDIDDGVTGGLAMAEQWEIVQLRRDKRRLEMENEVLGRAAAFLAKGALPR